MSTVPTISEAEMHVMEALWSAAPRTAAELTEQLAPATRWHRKTVNTLLSRLEKKGAITSQPAPGGKRYAPAVARETYTQSVAGAMVEQLYDGRVAPLVAQFADSKKLTRDDVEELEEILEALKNNG